jgi:hypothetical protein
MQASDNTQRGQALLMVTMVLFAMLGMIGLVVDLGWMYYTKKSAQSAADAAALAAVQQGDINGPFTGNWYISQDVTACTNPVPVPPSTNIEFGCLYAQRNGFVAADMQNVTLASGASALDGDGRPVFTSPPTAPNVRAYYWVTARVSQGVPQLFSSILSNTLGTSAARATAALVNMPVSGSLYALNREHDVAPFNKSGTGIDLRGGGGGFIRTAGGIFVASGASGKPNYAVDSNGSYTVEAPFVAFRDTGLPAPGRMLASTPVQLGMEEGANFQDPMSYKGGQPPAPTLNPNDLRYDHGIIGGVVNASCDKPLAPGYYYATTIVNGQPVATGQPVTFTGCPVFGGGDTTFSDFVFFGGVNFPVSPTFGPGKYLFAGALSDSTPIISQGNNVTVTANYPGATTGNWVPPDSTTNAGVILIFSNGTYPGLQVPYPVQAIQPDLGFGNINMQMGNNAQLELHGLNSYSPYLPANLLDYTPIVFWQDQRNSTIKYDSSGNVMYDVSCGGGGTLGTPCPNDMPNNPFMQFQAHPNSHLYGVFYQPRGAGLQLQAHEDWDTPLQFITGSIDMQGGSNITLRPLVDPLMRRVVSLVE